MIVYNITINIDESVHEEWLNWMRTSHIPDVMRTGLFIENRLLRILGDNESGGQTYSVQYTLESLDKYKQYEEVHSPALRGEFNSRYKDKYVSFRTLLEVID